LLLIAASDIPIWGIGGVSYVTGTPGTDRYQISVIGSPTVLYIHNSEHSGVIRALKDLKSDLYKVTGRNPELVYRKPKGKDAVIIVGTLGKSPLIDKLVQYGKIDVSDVKGRWEHYLIQVVKQPLAGVDEALVIAGSDKRGTIFGIYDVSEKIGVSPWYWWADVPVPHKESLYIKYGRYVEGPSVKYRGIFLNDEAPALSGWVRYKYGTVPVGEDSLLRKGVNNYNHEFYCRIFELLLRIKANYLWPAMWDNAFNEDDPENPRLADEWGIVMGTSHQEPMIRAQQEWDRRYLRTLGNWNYVKHPDVMEQFWREGIRRNKNYESIVTMGLRGANDSEMKGDIQSNIRMVESIIQKQQQILVEEMKKSLEEVPQMWCLYKEINEYYNQGMKVPDNVTLLWADDNWGYIRRLPDEAERKRKGGAGVYYHFDYHGGPRSYEWINTNPLPKIWDQMTLAKQYGADRIWIVNVGHFRGYELPTEYFMDLAWNTDRWSSDNTLGYTRRWAQREFGPDFALPVAEILSSYGKFNARRKPESLTPGTYSLIHYDEAERVVSEYRELEAKADTIAARLPEEYQDAFFHLALFPAKAGAILNELYVSAGKNRLYARQGRASAGLMAARTRELFNADTALMTYYNKVYANGRWNHFMDQTHIGYTNWNPPRRNSLNAIRLTEPDVPEAAGLGVAVEGFEESWPGSAFEPILPLFDEFGGEKHWIEVYNKGKAPFEFTIQANVPWVTFSKTNGTLGADQRIWVALDKSMLPSEASEGWLTVSGASQTVKVRLRACKPETDVLNQVKGFVESNGVVSIEASHFVRNIGVGTNQWLYVEDYGLTLSGMRATAPANPSAAVPGVNAPCLEYPVYLFSNKTVHVDLITSPVLNFLHSRDIRLAVSLNDGEPRYLTVVPANFSVQSSRTWGEGVLNQCRRLTTSLPVASAGTNTLKVWMVDPGVIVQKVVLRTSDWKPCYLGPPESRFVK
jgi:hypothetical protein